MTASKLLGRLFILATAALPLQAFATTISASSYFNFIDFREASSIGPGGAFLTFGGNFTPSGPPGNPTPNATTVVATQMTPQGLVTRNVPYLNFPAVPNQFLRSLPYTPTTNTPDFTGAWTLTVTNASASNSPFQITTLPIAPTLSLPFQSTPFISNVFTNNISTTPTFSWLQPGYTVPPNTSAAAQLLIFDVSVPGDPAVFTARLVNAAGLVSFPVTPSGNNQPLIVGHNYTISVETTLLNTADLGTLPGFGSAGSEVETTRSFFNFSPSASPVSFPGSVALPRIDPNGNFTFSFAVQAGVPVLLDPTVAIGYEFQIGQGDPLFASVEFPNLGNFSYDLYLWNGTQWIFDAVVAPLSQVDFGGNGVDRFEVLGIPPDLALNPSNSTAFVTQVSFETSGQFTGTMTPITANAPEPATLTLLGIGLAGLGFSRRHKLS